MLKKRVNKRGQDLSITTLVLIVLGVIVLVVVAIGVTQGFDSVFGWLPGFIPQDLEKTTQACNIYAQQDLTTSYCKEFKEIKTIEANNPIIVITTKSSIRVKPVFLVFI